LYAVVKHLQPTISSSLASIGGNDPNVRAKARVVTAKAIQTYDPASGASLPTWVSSQLRQLTRDVGKSNNVLSVPENAQLDAYHLYRTEVELEDELGRSPTVQELADRSAMSIKKIETVRKKIKAIATEGNFEADDGSSLL
jgi:DNA-directed RNA polymerase specialized sigma subunit